MKVDYYKPSQFNYTTYNDKSELLIYNTFTGKLFKALPDNAQKVREILSEQTIKAEAVEFQKLVDESFLVPSYANEHANLNSCYESFLNDSILQIMILPTHRCNCRCVYCYENFKGGVMSEKVQENLVKFVKERLVNCTALHILWFGGEPLIAMDVIRNLSTQFIEICKTEHKQYSASMTTNGTLLNLEVMRELQKYRVLSYQITIDGTKETHDMQRPLVGGGSSYDLIICNLLKIKEAIKIKTFIMFLRVNITKPIFAELDNYIHRMESMFGNDSRFRLHFCAASNWGGESIGNFKENLFSEDDNTSKVMLMNDFLVSHVGTTMNIYGGSGLYAGIVFDPGCQVDKKNYFNIDTTGIINKCAQQTRHIPAMLGDLSQDTLNFDEVEYAKWTTTVPLKIFDKCENCYMLPTGCYRSGSCILRRYQVKYINKLTVAEPECPQIKEDIDVNLCLLDKIGKSKQLEGELINEVV